jgi:hypothetical protein
MGHRHYTRRCDATALSGQVAAVFDCQIQTVSCNEPLSRATIGAAVRAAATLGDFRYDNAARPCRRGNAEHGQSCIVIHTIIVISLDGIPRDTIAFFQIFNDRPTRKSALRWRRLNGENLFSCLVVFSDLVTVC